MQTRALTPKLNAVFVLLSEKMLTPWLNIWLSSMAQEEMKGPVLWHLRSLEFKAAKPALFHF